MPAAAVCDDEPMSRQIAEGVVENARYRTLAGGGTAVEALDIALEALSLVLEHQPEDLVLDLALHGMRGEDIIGAIQECGGTRVIVHSSYDPRFAVKSGARLFASKGNIKVLEKMLLKVIGAE